MASQDEHIIPRYSAAAVAKFARLTEAAFDTAESGRTPVIEGCGTFPRAWFSTRERACRGLAQ